MKLNRIVGPVIPLPTPFKKDGSIDLSGMESYLEFLFTNGIRNVMTTVGTSRFNLLGIEEIKSVNKIVVEKAIAHNSVSIVANPLIGSTQHAQAFAKHAEEIGADYLLLYFPERHYGDINTLQYFIDIADNCNINILIHEMPRRNGLESGTVQYSLNLLEKLLEIPNIVGFKEEALDEDYSNAIVEKFSNNAIIIGAGGGMSRFLNRDFDRGAKAFLGGIGNFYPKVELDFYDSLISGDIKLAEYIVNKIEIPFFNAVVPYGWHPSLKVALSHKRLMLPYERTPMIQHTNESRAEIIKAVDKIFKYA